MSIQKELGAQPPSLFKDDLLLLHLVHFLVGELKQAGHRRFRPVLREAGQARQSDGLD
jgi:hypothetical protein